MTLPFWIPLSVELWLAAVITTAFICELGLSKSHVKEIALGGILMIFPLAIFQLNFTGTFLDGMVIIDPLARCFKVFFALTAILVLLMAQNYERHLKGATNEMYLLILLATLGMCMLISSNNFLLLFVSLETVTLSLYVMTTYLKQDVKSVEAGMKYLILGAISTAFLLYGIAFLYGFSGSANISAIQERLLLPDATLTWLGMGLVFVFAGLAFKIAVVPFHFWAPDVYEGAPTPVTAFLSVGSKAAGFAVALRLLHPLFQQGPWANSFLWVATLMAGATILYGNLVAIPQKNIKRLLAYSSIGHAGYLLIGIAVATTTGTAAMIYYLYSYLFANLAIFLVVVTVFNTVGSDEISAYAGLSRRSPLLAATMFVSLLSLAGVPPLAGFMGKFLLLWSAVQRDLLWLVIVGAIAVVISLYYYLMLIKQMYVEEPTETSAITVPATTKITLYVCMAATLLLGIYQAPFLKLSLESVRDLF